MDIEAMMILLGVFIFSRKVVVKIYIHIGKTQKKNNRQSWKNRG